MSATIPKQTILETNLLIALFPAFAALPYATVFFWYRLSRSVTGTTLLIKFGTIGVIHFVDHLTLATSANVLVLEHSSLFCISATRTLHYASHL